MTLSLNLSMKSAYTGLACILLSALTTSVQAATISFTFWTATGPQVAPSSGDLGVVVGGGRVLAVKQHDRLAELYDPATGTWVSAPSLLVARSLFTLTRLADGRALVVGGGDTLGTGLTLSSCEVYDPASGSWTLVGSLHTPRCAHVAQLLADGRVLIAGGVTTAHPEDDTFTAKLNSAEIWNPATGAWTETTPMHALRMGAGSTRMADGRVVVVGGYSGASGSLQPTGEAFSTSTTSWTSTASELPDPVVGFTMTTLLSGRMLLTGGQIPFAPETVVATPQLLDPATLTWSPTATMHASRISHGAVRLGDGSVLVAGGVRPNTGDPALASAELYSPAAATWSLVAPMHHGRAQHVAVRLTNGLVLVAGGDAAGTSEIFHRFVFRIPWWPLIRFLGPIVPSAAG